MNKVLSLENLPEFDQGSLALLFNQAARSIQLDLQDRPRLANARKLTIELEFRPDDSKGDLHVECAVRIKHSIPHKETRVNTLIPSTKHGGLMFNPDGYSPLQQSLPFGADD